MVGMALVQWRVGAIEENGYVTQGQNYVAFLQGSEMTAEFLFHLVKVSLYIPKMNFYIGIFQQFYLLLSQFYYN